MTVDADIREEITRRGLGRTLFVEAGAGTGKTTQLVERITNLVLDDGVRLSAIAAITFTEAAAAQLQDRIRVAFEKRLAEAEEAGDTAVAGRCQEAVADADMAAISTLHGFARRVLAEHPVRAGLPPRIEILDEVSSELAREERWERFVDALYADPGNEALLVRATLVGVALEPAYPGQVTMKDVAAELGQSWDRLDAVAGTDHAPLPEIDFGPFDRAVADLAACVDGCEDETDKFRVHLVESLLPSMQPIAALDDPHRKLGALAAASEWSRGRGGKPKLWRGGLPKDRVDAVNEARKAVLAEVAGDVLERLLTLVSREVRDAAESRRAEGRLEFHDLLVLARRLLRTTPDARTALHERYQRLLLDEFQDTDPIQIELAVLIASAVQGAEPPEWDEARVDDGRLFFVGDPKQSIYRFRRADIALFLKARDRFGPEGSLLRLSTNFRTVPEVVAWVNAAFGRLMDQEIPGRQPRYEPLVAHRRSSGGEGVDHRPVLLGAGHDRIKAGPLRELEARAVAATVDDIRRRPEAWMVHDPETRDWRPARLTDVTILVPTRTSLPYLREELAALDLPYRLNTGTLVYDTQEIRDAVSALRAVDDPTDELSLVAALRSPLYACSDADLLSFHAGGGRWDLTRTPPDELGDDHPVVAALAHLRSLWDVRWWTGPSGLLDRLLEQRRAFVLAFADGRPKEVWGRLRFLVDQARAFEEAGGGDLRAFLDWAELQRSESARVHEPVLPETDDHAVRIMTVHGAKGLEFPITILSGMTTEPGRARPGISVLWGDDGRPAIKLKADLATQNHDPRADLEAEMDVHEKLRLLYVACTRAQDHLVVACHHKVGTASYAQIVWELAQHDGDLWRTLPAVEAAAATEPSPGGAGGPGMGERDGAGDAGSAAFDADAVAAGRAAWIETREGLLAPQREARVVSATAVAQRAALQDAAPDPSPELVDEDDDVADLDAVDGGPSDGPLVVRRRGRAGTAVGRAVHATLQLLDLADPQGVDAQAARQADLETVPDLAGTVAALVRSALASGAVRRAAAGIHHKELYVAAPVGERVVEGYVDLLGETPDGLVVIDYKTDAVTSEADIDAKLAAYELQAAAYAVALERSTGLTVTSCHFVFCRLSGPVEREVADLEGAKRRVRELLGAPPGP